MIPKQPSKKVNDYNLDFIEGKQPSQTKLAFDIFPRKIVFFFAILAFIAAFMLLWHPKPRPNYSAIKNFEDCAAAGYPVMQSYPPQCTLPNGSFFVQEFVPER